MKGKLVFSSLIAISLISSVSSAEKKSETKQPQVFYNAPARFEVKNGVNLFVTADLLYWQAQEDDLEIAVDSKSQTTLRGRVINPHFQWEPGFRVGLGYNIPHDKWDLYLNFTHFHGIAHRNKQASSDGALYPVWMNPMIASGVFASQAKAHWKMNFNMADLELGRSFFVGRWLSLRPLIGLKGGTVEDKYDLEYKGGSLGGEDKVDMNKHFWGVGIRMGLDTLWGLGKGFGVYGNGAFSLLSGKFHLHQKERFRAATNKFFSIKDHISMTVGFAELALGIQWDHMFGQDRYHLGLKLGWELNLLFNQNLFIRFLSPTNHGAFTRSDGDLSLQGVTLGFRFDF